MSLQNRAFLGEGLFETIRVMEGAPVYSVLHWQRMRNSALKINLPFRLTLNEWQAGLCKTINDAKLHNGGVKVVLLGGKSERGLIHSSIEAKLLFEIFSCETVDKPARLTWASWSRDAKNPLYQIKSINYLEFVLAKRQAQAAEVDDVVFLNFNKHITETSIANIFFIMNNMVCTPSLACGVLPGIIRQRILEICAKNNIAFEEREIPHTLVADAQAVFTTNAIQGIQTVACLATYEYPSHPLIHQLKDFLKEDRLRSRILN